jgi:hypothetical protein
MKSVLKSSINFCLLFICNLSCSQNVSKSEVFVGNNKYYLPAEIIETNMIWENNQISDFSKKTYERLPEQRGKVCTVLKNNNVPYSIIYNNINYSKKTDSIISLSNFKVKYDTLIKNFEIIKEKSIGKSYSIYGYYASIGSSETNYDQGLYIITKDDANNYFISTTFNLCEYCNLAFRPMKINKSGFERENAHFQGNFSPEILSKEIYYEHNGNFIVKDLYYVKETDDMYVDYLLKIR